MNQMQVRVLRPNKLKTIGGACGSALLALVGAWMVTAGESTGWGLVLFFGLVAVVLAATALPNSSYLAISPEGFRVCSLFRSHSYLWSDVGPFSVGKAGRLPMVVFNFSDTYKATPRLRKFASGIAGFEGGLPDSYGLQLSELAQLLNEYRNNSHAA